MALATPVLSDAATLSTTGTVSSSLPLTNLQTMQPGEVCRFTSLTGMMIVADLGSAKAINWVELINHNGTSAATWRIRGADTEGNLTASPGYDSGTVSMWPASGKPSDTGLQNLSSLLYLTTAQTYRWWRIDITDAANPATYWQAGRLYIANAWVPEKNLSYGVQYGFIDTSQRYRTPGGNTLPINRARLKRVAFSLGFMDEDEAFGKAWPIDLDRGMGKDVSFYENPEATTHRHRKSVYGLLSDMSPIEHLYFPVHSKGYVIEELLP